jgi:nucleoside-diphosphate-sugar epimerase
MMARTPRRALVTGANGFLARHVVGELLRRGLEVTAMVRQPGREDPLIASLDSAERSRLHVVHGDFVKEADCRRAAVGCDVVYHIGAQMTGAFAPLILTNVVGTKRLIAAAADAGVKRFVLVSSIAVYDTRRVPTGGAVDEAAPLEPNPHWRDPYTFSKVQQETAAGAACASLGLPLVIVRPGVIHGDERGTMSARVGLKLGRWVLHVAGRRRLPYTHVRNCAVAVTLAGLVEGVDGHSFTIVDDVVPRGVDVIRAYRRAGHGLHSIRVPYPVMRLLGRANAWYHHRSTGQLPAVLTPYKVAAMWRCLRYSNANAKRMLAWQPEPQGADTPAT